MSSLDQKWELILFLFFTVYPVSRLVPGTQQMLNKYLLNYLKDPKAMEGGEWLTNTTVSFVKLRVVSLTTYWITCATPPGYLLCHTPLLLYLFYKTSRVWGEKKMFRLSLTSLADLRNPLLSARPCLNSRPKGDYLCNPVIHHDFPFPHFSPSFPFLIKHHLAS